MGLLRCCEHRRAVCPDRRAGASGDQDQGREDEGSDDELSSHVKEGAANGVAVVYAVEDANAVRVGHGLDSRVCCLSIWFNIACSPK